MKTLLKQSLLLTLFLVVITAVLYPLLIAGVAKLSPGSGGGRKVLVEGKVVGYENIGQKFTDDKYFWSRPSAVDYNAAGSAGSNKGPMNPDYLAQVQARIDTFLVHNPGISKEQIPSELVTASGSGLDPNLSPDAALIQISRISKIRNIEEAKLTQLVNSNIEGPFMGIFGPSKVNVLKLNVALDAIGEK